MIQTLPENRIKFPLAKTQALALSYLRDKTTKEVLFGGAAGGGKTVLGCYWQIRARGDNPGSRGLIGRQTHKDIYATIMLTFAQIAEKCGAGKSWNYTVNEAKGEIQFTNGSIIFLRDLAYKPTDPLFDRLKLEITDAWIEEATQTGESAFKAILPRIRYKLNGLPPKILLTSNPGHNWLKFRYVKSKEGKDVILQPHQKFIPSLVSDNPDRAFAKEYEANLQELDELTKSMYLRGSWDINLNENPFFYSFADSVHSQTSFYQMNSQLPLDISFDFNKNPSTAVIGQRTSKGDTVFDVMFANDKTFAGLSPIQALCRLIREKYLDTGLSLPHMLRVTGDASGESGSADRIAGITFYSQVVEGLKISRSQLKVRRANIGHGISRDQINYILHALGDYNQITTNCYHLIQEIETAFPDDSGTLNAYKKQAGGHSLDAWRYLMDMWYPVERFREICNEINNRRKLVA